MHARHKFSFHFFVRQVFGKYTCHKQGTNNVEWYNLINMASAQWSSGS